MQKTALKVLLGGHFWSSRTDSKPFRFSRGCQGIHFTVEAVYFFIKLLLLFPHPNRTKSTRSCRVLGQLPADTPLSPWRKVLLGGPGCRGQQGGDTSSGICKNLIRRATVAPSDPLLSKINYYCNNLIIVLSTNV